MSGKENIYSRLVAAGFRIAFAADDSCIVTTASGFGDAVDVIKPPVTKVRMPMHLPVRYQPNQNRTTYVFAPKNPVRVPITNSKPKYENLDEQRIELADEYSDYIEKVAEKRRERIERRLEQHQEYLDQVQEAETRTQERVRQGTTISPNEEAVLEDQKHTYELLHPKKKKEAGKGK